MRNIVSRKLTWFILGLLTGFVLWAWYEHHIQSINVGVDLFGPPSATEIQQAAEAVRKVIENWPLK